MEVSLFDFELPSHCIATHPARPRDSAKLLHVSGGKLHDHTIRSLPELVGERDVLVLNDTRVLPARLRGKRGEVSVEILLHKRLSAQQWSAFARPGKRLKPGDTIRFIADGKSFPPFTATVEEKCASGEIILTFPDEDISSLLQCYGEMPLPPYIARPEGAETSDAQDYQTCYAQKDGSVAAPTAGLHFTPELLQRIRERGADIVFVTLHVGGGTFLPVKAERTEEHHMHSEWGEIGTEAAKIINRARSRGGNIIPVGTTALRILETVAGDDGELRAWTGETDIFITPGYRFKIADRLLTNFHLPRSTLFMLVSAFAGLEHMHAAYRHAIRSGYRFYSYGDACMLEKNQP